MIHRYKMNGLNIVLDVCSGSVHLVDEVAYELIGLYETKPREECVRAALELFPDENEDEIRQCLDEIELLKQNGSVIRLTASPETVLKRIKADGPVRPLLQGTKTEEDLLQHIRKMEREREQFYAQTADVTIETDGKKASETAELIRKAAGI